MADDNDILNRGLAFALEFGENWLEPIQTKLAEVYPHLTAEELDHYNQLCKEVASDGNALIFKVVHEDGEDFYSEKNRQLWQKTMLQKYPWINEKNLSHSYSQSCYYALK